MSYVLNTVFQTARLDKVLSMQGSSLFVSTTLGYSVYLADA